MRSEGAAQLEAVTRRHGAAGVARALDASEAAVRAWRDGDRTPKKGTRNMLAEKYGIAVELWECPEVGRPGSPPPRAGEASAPPQRVPEAPPPPTPRPTPKPVALVAPAAPAAGLDPLAVAQSTVVALQEALRSLDSDAEATARERAALGTALVGATRLLARLSGSLEVTQSAICRSAAWARILAAFEKAFDPVKHPGARGAVEDFVKLLQGATE